MPGMWGGGVPCKKDSAIMEYSFFYFRTLKFDDFLFDNSLLLSVYIQNVSSGR